MSGLSLAKRCHPLLCLSSRLFWCCRLLYYTEAGSGSCRCTLDGAAVLARCSEVPHAHAQDTHSRSTVSYLRAVDTITVPVPFPTYAGPYRMSLTMPRGGLTVEGHNQGEMP